MGEYTAGRSEAEMCRAMQQFPLMAGSSYTSDVGTCLAGSFDELICRLWSPTRTRRSVQLAALQRLAAILIQLCPDRRCSTVWTGASRWS